MISRPISQYQLVYDWARYANSDLGKTIAKKQIGVTHALVRSRRFGVTGSGNDVQKAWFSFNDYGKFPDMGVGRGQGLGDVKGNAQLYKAAGIKGRKAKKWFSKVIYPEANTLAQLLADNYGLQISAEINESLSDSVILSL